MKMHPSKDWVATIIAIGLATALNLITFAAIYDALFSNAAGLSDNAVNLLTGWGGGMVGIVGAYVGYKASRNDNGPDDQE
jgi:hypothetical protein